MILPHASNHENTTLLRHLTDSICIAFCALLLAEYLVILGAHYSDARTTLELTAMHVSVQLIEIVEGCSERPLSFLDNT